MLEVTGARIELDGFALSADLAVPGGALAALIGPSGGGKSTLLNAIAGFAPLTAGQITVDGRRIDHLPPPARPVSMLFQEHNLFSHLDAAGNVALGLSPRGARTKADRARVAAALAEVGLAGFERRRPAALSGGQRSRVAIARALLRDRPVLLLDEPFAALGPGMRAEMTALVRALLARTGAAALLVTHDPGEARAADLVSVVGEGRAAAPRPAAETFDDPPPALRDWLGSAGPR